MTVNCQVAHNHPSPERARWRLDEVAGGPLREALASVLAPLAKADSREVVLIRRLQIDLELDMSRDTPALARRWAARLGADLAAAIHPESTASGVLRFPTWAHYLARFLIDVAGGRAWDKWYYSRFQGLRPLSAPAVIRTVVLDTIEIGLSALRALTPPELAQVLRALGEREARRIVETVGASGNDGAGLDGAAAAVADAFPAWRAVPMAAPPLWVHALGLLVLSSGALESGSWPAAARVAQTVAAFEESRRASEGEQPVAAGGARAGDVSTSTQSSAHAKRTLMPALLARLSEPQRSRLAAAIGEQPATADGVARSEEPVWTRFGGLLMLFPHIASLPLADEWPNESDRAMARLLVLAHCAGGERALGVLTDPVIQRLAGVIGDPASMRIVEWLEANEEHLAYGFRSRLARQRASDARSLVLTPGRVAGRPVLAAATAEGYWVLLTTLSSSQRAGLRAGQAQSLAQDALDATTLGEVLVDVDLSIARAATRMLRYVRVPDFVSGSFEAELALAIAAQHVLCGFARRLPGFAESSPGYLYRNFLDVDAVIEESETRRVCRLTRPPLATLLNMTGALRGRIAVPWLSGPALELTFGG